MKKIILSVLTLSTAFAYAGGFRVSLQGIRQLAQAHTSAHADDASVAFFNPAGISFIPAKLSIAGGAIGVKNKITYQNPATGSSYETNSPIGTPFYFAAAYKINPTVSVGLSVTTPFGSTIEWPSDWAGRDIVQRLSLKAIYFQPVISFRLSDEVSVGGSYIYSKGVVDWTRGASNLGGSLNIKDEKASGSGFGLGFYFRPSEKLDVSIAYRGPVSMKADEGVATFSVPASLFPVLGLSSSGTDSFKATLPLASEYTLGFTYKFMPTWSVSADFNYTGWEKYDRLTLKFANAPIGNQPDRTVSVSPKNYHNTKTYRVGTQYSLSDKLVGRLGYYYDETPYDDDSFAAETPSFNTHVVTGGVGYAVSKSFGVDLAGGLSFPQSRTVDNEFYNFRGQAKAKAFFFGLGLTYNAF